MFSQINSKIKYFLTGFAASLSLLLLYFLILSFANSFSHAIEQFLEMWYLVIILSLGFGMQVGLYVFIKDKIKEKQAQNPTAIIAASGGVSTGAMIACCLHHIADVTPIIGLSAAAVFLTQYQIFFVWVGILSNIIGIAILLEIVQKHRLAEGPFRKLLFLDMGKVKVFTLISTAIILGFFLIMISGKKVEAPIGENTNMPAVKSLEPKTDEQGNITFEITPVDFNPAQPVKFEIKIDTHTGSLNFDLTKTAVLEDDKGNKYYPVSWQGSDPGGHHRSGILAFPAPEKNVKTIQLTIQESYKREFSWSL